MPEKGVRCCVKDCFMGSHNTAGARINENANFFRIPKVKTHQGSQMKDVSSRRRLAWVSAINLEGITFTHSPEGARVCSRHFHEGNTHFTLLSLIISVICQFYYKSGVFKNLLFTRHRWTILSFVFVFLISDHTRRVNNSATLLEIVLLVLYAFVIFGRR